MSWYVIDSAAASRTIINMLISIITSIHIDISYLNTFIWELKVHNIQQYNANHKTEEDLGRAHWWTMHIIHYFVLIRMERVQMTTRLWRWSRRNEQNVYWKGTIWRRIEQDNYVLRPSSNDGHYKCNHILYCFCNIDTHVTTYKMRILFLSSATKKLFKTLESKHAVFYKHQKKHLQGNLIF